MSDISVKVFQAVVAGAAADGVAPTELLAAAGVDPGNLADPDMRFPRAIEARLWSEAARLTRDDSFGVRLAERLPVGSLGALGFAVRSGATVGEAYARAARYLRVVAIGPSLEIQIDGDVARLRHEPPRSSPAPSRHAVEFFLGNLVVLARVPRQEPVSRRFIHDHDGHRRGGRRDHPTHERSSMQLTCHVLPPSDGSSVVHEAFIKTRARPRIGRARRKHWPTAPAGGVAWARRALSNGQIGWIDDRRRPAPDSSSAGIRPCGSLGHRPRTRNGWERRFP
ncbi:AraC family transcriptional regulator [Sorangium sp. So ce281]|uniref:AraC family transcriptional regulator n=1 Tax=unclassified Sorangium TaxID=2621164 RepID=UPI003F61D102